MAQSTRKKHCGNCKLTGHSIRTCPEMKQGMKGKKKYDN